MAIEQDWAAYADQSTLADTDTLLARTSAGAGVEVPGSALIKKDVNGIAPVPYGLLGVDGAYLGFGASFYSGAWRNAVASQGGSALRFAGGVLTWFFGPSPGAAGSSITGFQERIRFGDNGEVMMNQTALGLQNANGVSLNAAGGTSTWNHSGTTSGWGYHQFGYNGTQIGSITQSGTTAVLYNTTSDERMKRDIEDAGDAGAILDQVQVRQFTWTTDESHQPFGFIAQELVEVVPEAVHVPLDEAAMWAIDYSKLVPLLVKEVQSLRARVAELEAAK